jgi:hypothetical protein
MWRHGILLGLVLGCGGSPSQPAARSAAKEVDMIAIHDFEQGLKGVQSASPEVKLRIVQDAELAGEPALQVDYPEANDNPAGRDVACDADERDWAAGRALSFRVKAEQPLKIAVSFLDRNKVVYTSWVTLQPGVWQPVRLPFAEMKPNPYFQPPDAKTGSPIDVSDVAFIAFAPQSPGMGRFTISRFRAVE